MEGWWERVRDRGGNRERGREKGGQKQELKGKAGPEQYTPLMEGGAATYVHAMTMPACPPAASQSSATYILVSYAKTAFMQNGQLTYFGIIIIVQLFWPFMHEDTTGTIDYLKSHMYTHSMPAYYTYIRT